MIYLMQPNKKSVVFINEILNFNIDIFDISKKI